MYFTSLETGNLSLKSINHVETPPRKREGEKKNAYLFSKNQERYIFFTTTPGRSESHCKSRGCEFDPGLVPYFCGD